MAAAVLDHFSTVHGDVEGGEGRGALISGEKERKGEQERRDRGREWER